MQRNRRQDPYPLTWEIPAGIFVGVLLLLVLGLQVGRGIANLLAGGWWAFPDREHLFSALPALLAGDSGAGLSSVEAVLASPRMLWTCVIGVESALLILIIIGFKLGLDRWGPRRIQGLATASEVAKLLGRSRLRRHAAIIRPDLYGKQRRQP